jgi:hypothetical protein
MIRAAFYILLFCVCVMALREKLGQNGFIVAGVQRAVAECLKMAVQ